MFLVQLKTNRTVLYKRPSADSNTAPCCLIGHCLTKYSTSIGWNGKGRFSIIHHLQFHI